MKRISFLCVTPLLILALPLSVSAATDTTPWSEIPSQLNDVISVLRFIIPVGTVPRVIHCLAVIATDADQEASYKKRLRNLLIFVAVAESAVSLLYIIYRYFV